MLRRDVCQALIVTATLGFLRSTGPFKLARCLLIALGAEQLYRDGLGFQRRSQQPAVQHSLVLGERNRHRVCKPRCSLRRACQLMTLLPWTPQQVPRKPPRPPGPSSISIKGQRALRPQPICTARLWCSVALRLGLPACTTTPAQLLLFLTTTRSLPAPAPRGQMTGYILHFQPQLSPCLKF